MQITAAESQVMEVLWRRGPLTFEDLLAEVTVSQAWGRATVKTLVNRLLKKKAVASDRSTGRHQYRALVERADYVNVESQGLLDRLFEGELTPLISHFAEYRKLKPAEIKRLKRLIEEIEGDE